MKNIVTFVVAILYFGSMYSQTVGSRPNMEADIAKYMTDSLEVIAARIEQQVIPARYMEQTFICKTDTLNGWKGIEVSLYNYKVHGTDIIAKVYLADADSKKMASWIITTCVSLTGKLSKTNSDKLIKDIRFASGGQFPVLGMVYEDMYGTG
ncbi:MAG: hypothetical protein PHX13_12770, partial [Thiovulaceae bacterium]|nr:hypothetical protein [Sulfurimonadaceae bacterium]